VPFNREGETGPGGGGGHIKKRWPKKSKKVQDAGVKLKGGIEMEIYEGLEETSSRQKYYGRGRGEKRAVLEGQGTSSFRLKPVAGG